MSTSWLRQTKEEPLFPDLIWARPERKDRAGKLLIIGGSSHGFVSTIKSAEFAKAAGIGEIKVMLPKGVSHVLGHPPETIALDQTDAGSFARSGLDEAIGALSWANAVLIPGELSKNAETTIFTEELLDKNDLPVIVAGDALDIYLDSNGRSANVVAVADFKQAQKLVNRSNSARALLSNANLDDLVKVIQESLGGKFSVFVLLNEDQALVLDQKRASLTKTELDPVEFAARAAVLCAQFPNKLFEATTSSSII